MKKSAPDRLACRRDPLRLERDRVQSFAADNLVLEIAADRASRRQPRDIARSLGRVVRIGAFEVDRDGKVDRLDDPLGIGQREVQRHLLAIAEPIGHGDRRAPRRDRPGAGLGYGLRAARRPTTLNRTSGSPGTCSAAKR